MSNAQRWYTTREAVKAGVGAAGTAIDSLIDQYIETASEDVENTLRRRFIPETAIKYFRWPQALAYTAVLEFPDEDLLAVTTLQSEAQNAAPVAIVAADYFLEPVNDPPYQRIEIDLSSSSAFASGDTPQRSIAVTGRWGYSEDTKAAGALAGAIASTSATTCGVTDSSLIGVGDTILIGTEALFVSAKALLTTGTTLNDASVTASKADVVLTVADGTKIKQGEIITLDGERCRVESISANDVTVERAVDGSVLAAHTTGITIYAPRTLTIVRGVNGTTAATALDAAAITKYAPPADIVAYVRAMAIAMREQEKSGWTGVIAGEGALVETRMFNLFAMKNALIEKYRKVGL